MNDEQGFMVRARRLDQFEGASRGLIWKSWRVRVEAPNGELLARFNVRATSRLSAKRKGETRFRAAQP